MTYNEKGLFYVKPTKFYIEPDAHACSYNELKSVKIEQEQGTVSLTKKEVRDLFEFSLEHL